MTRHSFANCLKQKSVATDIVSESLRYQNLTVTQTYLKELESSVLIKRVKYCSKYWERRQILDVPKF